MNMALLWIPATIIAAAAQTVRNAMQRSLTGTIGTVGATQVRFLYGLPFALLFLLLVVKVGGESVPAFDARVVLFTIGGAVTQIAATALMLLAMRERSFAVTTAIIKTEPVLVAIAGLLILGDVPTPVAALGILVATAGVILLSIKPGSRLAWSSSRPVVIGVVAGGMFALSSIGYRGGILALPSGSFVLRATSVLALGLCLQTAILVVWMLLFDRRALFASFGAWRQSIFAGFMGAFASQFWFIGFSLTSAANVRTLALIEVLFAQGISARLFRQGTDRRELAAMALIVAGVVFLLWGAR